METATVPLLSELAGQLGKRCRARFRGVWFHAVLVDAKQVYGHLRYRVRLEGCAVLFEPWVEAVQFDGEA